MKIAKPTPSREIDTETSRAHQQKMGRRFLRGPIPIIDLALATRLGGHGLALLILIHHRAAVTGNRSVTLPKNLLQEFGVSRDVKARALRDLQDASLIVVERSRGRTARVTLTSDPLWRRLTVLAATATASPSSEESELDATGISDRNPRRSIG
jgi:hypothetical protein